MSISKNMSISTERETIAHIFMRKKYYIRNSNLSTKNSTMSRRRILMKTLYFNKDEDLVKEECKLGYKEYDNDEDDSKED